MRFQILFLVLCLSISLVNAWEKYELDDDSEEVKRQERKEEYLKYKERTGASFWNGYNGNYQYTKKAIPVVNEFKDPLEEEGKELLSYKHSDEYFKSKAKTGGSLWNGYNRLYQYSKKAIPVVNQFANQIQIINEQYKKFVNEIQTNDDNAWNINLKNIKDSYKTLAHESRRRLYYIDSWVINRRPYLDQKIDYKVLNLIHTEINEESDTIDFIEKKLDEGVSLLEKLIETGGKNALRVIIQTNQIKKEIASKKVGEKTVDAVSLIRRLREQYNRFSFMKFIYSNQSNLLEVVA